MKIDKWRGHWPGVVLLGLLACGGKSDHREWHPVIERFEASKTSIDPGSEVVLSARYVAGVGTVGPEGLGLPSGGELRVKPMVTTAYTLTVTPVRGPSVQRRVTIEVRPGLKVKIKGFEGMAGPVTLTGPGGYTRTLTASGLVSGLADGTYTVTAKPVPHGSSTLHPAQPVQTIQLNKGAAVTVLYPAPSFKVTLPGAIPLEFVLIPAGNFLMGNDHPVDPDLFPSPSPAHRVDLPKAFYMARYLTTQAQWVALAGHNPSWKTSPQNNPSRELTLEEAVDSVSFDSIKDRFLPELNRTVTTHHFRLPSEAEWEYACRAGTTTTYFYGEDPAEGAKYAWTFDNYREKTAHPVGTFLPNPWGLYDLTGLLFQWCEDLPHHGYTGAPSDGSAWLTPGTASHSDMGIIRGYGPIIPPGVRLVGSSSARWANHRSGHETVGFRLVADIPAR